MNQEILVKNQQIIERKKMHCYLFRNNIQQLYFIVIKSLLYLLPKNFLKLLNG